MLTAPGVSEVCEVGPCSRLPAKEQITLPVGHPHCLWLAFLLLTSPPYCAVLSRSVVSHSATPWTAARQASLSITNSWSLLKLMTIELVMPSNHPVIPFSFCPQSFPASGSFQMNQLFTSGGQSIGVSALASVLPMNI